jgi:Zn-finger nucleic acid-binding protein
MANCVNCGAPLAPDDSRGALTCNHCGTLNEPTAPPPGLDLGPVTETPCPSCAAPLHDSRLEGLPLLFCDGCQGMLVSMPLFVAVIDAARMQEPRGVSAVLPRRQKPDERTLACPSCHRPMLSHIYGGPGNLVIDTCEACECNWLDGGELRRIARAPQGRREL